MIINSSVKHEIGTHTFSHIDFSDKNCPIGVARDELKASRDAASPYGINLKSMVFPGGTWGNIEALKENGIQIYRKSTDCGLAYPYRDEHGLLVTPTSTALEFNLAYDWAIDYYFKRIKKYIERAVQTNTIAHFWFHVSLQPIFIYKLFPQLFEYADSLRKRGILWIGTMKDIASHINGNKVI